MARLGFPVCAALLAIWRGVLIVGYSLLVVPTSRSNQTPLDSLPQRHCPPPSGAAKFECSVDGTEFPSCRLVLTLMGVLASVNCYTTRVNLSVALVVMVNNSWVASLSGGTETTGHLSPCVGQYGNQTVEVRHSHHHHHHHLLNLVPNPSVCLFVCLFVRLSSEARAAVDGRTLPQRYWAPTRSPVFQMLLPHEKHPYREIYASGGGLHVAPALHTC